MPRPASATQSVPPKIRYATSLPMGAPLRPRRLLPLREGEADRGGGGDGGEEDGGEHVRLAGRPASLRVERLAPAPERGRVGPQVEGAPQDEAPEEEAPADRDLPGRLLRLERGRVVDLGLEGHGVSYLCSAAWWCSPASCAFWLRSHETTAHTSSSSMSFDGIPPTATPGRPRAGLTSLPNWIMAA